MILFSLILIYLPYKNMVKLFISDGSVRYYFSFEKIYSC